MKYKLMTILGTRPEIIRMSEILKNFDKSFNHSIVYTNQNSDYNLSSIFFKEFGIRKPKYNLNANSNSLFKTIGLIFEKLDIVIKRET